MLHWPRSGSYNCTEPYMNDSEYPFFLLSFHQVVVIKCANGILFVIDSELVYPLFRKQNHYLNQGAGAYGFEEENMHF